MFVMRGMNLKRPSARGDAESIPAEESQIPKQRTEEKGRVWQTQGGKHIIIRWTTFICRTGMRLVSIVDYQINCLRIKQAPSTLSVWGKVESSPRRQ